MPARAVDLVVISNRNQSNIRDIRKLLIRKHRDETGLFLVEGIRQTIALWESRHDVETMIIAPDLLSSEAAWNLIARHRTEGGKCLTVSADVFASISNRDNPQGLAAVARSKVRRLQDIDTATDRLWVALFEPQDPGNVGTIARTCDAVGANGLIVIGNSVDLYHPRAIRASAGAMFTCDLFKTDFEELLPWAKQWGIALIGTSDSAVEHYRERIAERDSQAVLVMGSERQGIPLEIVPALDHLVRIPMLGMCDSLNLAVATSIILYEWTQRAQENS